VQYGHFSNDVRSPLSPSVSYDARAWAASLEYGYGVPLGATWLVEPAAQVIYTHYGSDSLTDVTDTRVQSVGEGSTTERVAVRVYPAPSSNAAVRPFAEINYWHDGGSRAMAFNGIPVSADTPNARYELAAGFQARIGAGWVLSARIANNWGRGSYRVAAGQLGARYSW
jgi:outer membrane autotransporter protein